MVEVVLEGYILRLLGYGLVDDRVRLLDEAYVSYLFDLRLHEKLVLLIVHYFIDYSNLTHQNPDNKYIQH